MLDTGAADPNVNKLLAGHDNIVLIFLQFNGFTHDQINKRLLTAGRVIKINCVLGSILSYLVSQRVNEID